MIENPPDDEYVEKVRQQAKKEVFDGIEDILENYKGNYFKININKFNELKKGHTFKKDND